MIGVQFCSVSKPTMAFKGTLQQISLLTKILDYGFWLNQSTLYFHVLKDGRTAIYYERWLVTDLFNAILFKIIMKGGCSAKLTSFDNSGINNCPPCLYTN